MKFLGKKEPFPVQVKGQQLKCSICGNDQE